MPLTIKPPRRPSNPELPAGAYTTSNTGSRDHSPTPPLASPISPTLQPLKTEEQSVVELISRPAPQPFSGEDATDAIALRAAISSLQVQRKKAEEDIRTLQRIKDDALARPQEFQSHVVETATRQAKKPTKFDIHGSEVGEHQDEPARKFPPIPEPQDLVRCPPINWDKYHVVGESLDRMHDAQQVTPRGGRIATPYDPAFDRLEGRGGSMSREARKDSAASAGIFGGTPGADPKHKMSGSR